MECKTARMLLEFARPLEMDPQEGEALEGHLHDCPRCAHAARREQRVDRHLATAIQHVPLPGDLHQRLLTRLRDERRKGYRRRASILAAAAVILLATGIGMGFWLRQRPSIDVPEFADGLPIPGSTAAQVENWFLTSYRVKTVLPRYLKYQYFVSAGRQELKGKLVPRLFFANGQESAQVWVLTSDQFDLKKSFQDWRVAGSGKIRIELIGDPDDSVAYLVFYFGEGANWQNWLIQEDAAATS